MLNSNLKILWAYDPYADLKSTWQKSAKLIYQLQKKHTSIEVEPVYVLGAEMLHWMGHITLDQFEKLVPAVIDEISKQLSEFNITNLKPPKVLKGQDLARRTDVSLLNSYAEDSQCDLILINTHAREGVSRFFMGSFAETLMLESRKPLLLLNPNTNSDISAIENVFCPLDFSKTSYESMDKLLTNPIFDIKKIVIFSKVTRPINAFTQTCVQIFGGGWVAPEQYISMQSKNYKEEAEALKAKAQKMGFDVEVILDDTPKSVDEAIVQNSLDTQSNLIMMGTHSGPITTTLMGSTTRNVVRLSTLPTIVYHTKEDLD